MFFMVGSEGHKRKTAASGSLFVVVFVYMYVCA